MARVRASLNSECTAARQRPKQRRAKMVVASRVNSATRSCDEPSQPAVLSGVAIHVQSLAACPVPASQRDESFVRSLDPAASVAPH
jgi:hypothetical protein